MSDKPEWGEIDDYSISNAIGELRGIRENGFRAKSKSMGAHNQRTSIDLAIAALKRSRIRQTAMEPPEHGKTYLVKVGRLFVTARWVKERSEEATYFEMENDCPCTFDEENDVYYLEQGWYECSIESGIAYQITEEVMEYYELPEVTP